jgi:hypothetical protein
VRATEAPSPEGEGASMRAMSSGDVTQPPTELLL